MMNEEDRRRHDKSWNDPPLFTSEQMRLASIPKSGIRAKRYANPVAPEVAGRRASFPGQQQMMQQQQPSYPQPGIMPPAHQQHAMHQQGPGWGQQQPPPQSAALYQRQPDSYSYGQPQQQPVTPPPVPYQQQSSYAPPAQSPIPPVPSHPIPHSQHQGFQPPSPGYMNQAPAGNNWGQGSAGQQEVPFTGASPYPAAPPYGQPQQQPPIGSGSIPNTGPGQYVQSYGMPYGQ